MVLEVLGGAEAKLVRRERGYVIIVCRLPFDGRLRFSNPGCRPYDTVLTGIGRWYAAPGAFAFACVWRCGCCGSC